MFITNEEIFTHLYPEHIAAISDNDERFLTAAIKGAITQAKGYLHKYDAKKIFESEAADRDPFLLIIIKDIAVWHYINIANPNIDFSIREKRYNDAIAWLRGVQKGDIIPDFPVPTDDDGNKENNTGFRFGSNPKRIQHLS